MGTHGLLKPNILLIGNDTPGPGNALQFPFNFSLFVTHWYEPGPIDEMTQVVLICNALITRFQLHSLAVRETHRSFSTVPVHYHKVVDEPALNSALPLHVYSYGS